MRTEKMRLVGITQDHKSVCRICGQKVDSKVKSFLLVATPDYMEYFPVCDKHVGKGVLGDQVEVTFN